MRSHRAVEDDDVDRPQVQAWRHAQPSGTNSPSALPVQAHALELAPGGFRWDQHQESLFCFQSIAEKSYSGGFGPGVPPLPIPNREVKPGRADGTAPQCGRVGRRLLEVLRRDAFRRNPDGVSLSFYYVRTMRITFRTPSASYFDITARVISR